MKKEQLNKFFEKYDLHQTLDLYVESQAIVNTPLEKDEELEDILLDVQYKEVSRDTTSDFVSYHVVDKENGVYVLTNVELSEVEDFIEEI